LHLLGGERPRIEGGGVGAHRACVEGERA
jgi:hypothetical protein